MAAHLDWCPVQTILDVFNRLSSETPDVVVQYTEKLPDGEDGKPTYGMCEYPGPGEPEGCPIYVTLSAQMPFYGVLDVLGHELAHAVAGVEHGHDETWRAAFDEISERYKAQVAT